MLGCLDRRVRLPVRPNPNPPPIDDFLCPRSSISRPTTVFESLSGVDRSRYFLPLRFEGGATGATTVFGKLDDVTCRLTGSED